MNFFFAEDSTETIIPFEYPSADPTLAHATWQEYNARKQEQDNQSSTNQNEQVNY